MVEVVVLGSGTGIPHPRRGSPGLALSGEGELMVVDLGPGALRAMARAGLDYRSLRRLLFTHYHVDHVCDLAALLFASRHRRQGELQVIGPPGLRALVAGLRAVHGASVEPADYTLLVAEPEEGDHALGPWGVRVGSVPHTSSSVAYRIEAGGVTIAVTGDTPLVPSLVELARGADLLIAECSYPDELMVEGHLTPRLVGELAREARVGQVLLTHMYPETDSFDLRQDCRRAYDGTVTVGYDLLRLEVGR